MISFDEKIFKIKYSRLKPYEYLEYHLRNLIKKPNRNVYTYTYIYLFYIKNSTIPIFKYIPRDMWFAYNLRDDTNIYSILINKYDLNRVTVDTMFIEYFKKHFFINDIKCVHHSYF